VPHCAANRFSNLRPSNAVATAQFFFHNIGLVTFQTATMKENNHHFINDQSETSHPTALVSSKTPSTSPTAKNSTISESKFPNPVCNICGVGRISNQLNAVLELSGQFTSCGELEAAGLIGQIPPSTCDSLQDPSFLASCECSTSVRTNEYNTTISSANTTLLMPTFSPTELVPSLIPTNNPTAKPSVSHSMLPSVHPSILITTIEPSKVDLPSLRPSSSPSSSTQDLAITAPSLSSTTLQPVRWKEPTSSTLDSDLDLMFSSGNSEGDVLNVDNDAKPNAGLGIGLGLLVITPLAILVIVIIFEIKRRQRTRNRNKTILPLRSTATQKAHVLRRTRNGAMSVQIIPPTNATKVCDVTERKKSIPRVSSKTEISAKDARAKREMKAATIAYIATLQSTQTARCALATNATSSGATNEMNGEVRSRNQAMLSIKSAPTQTDHVTSQIATGARKIQMDTSVPTTSATSVGAASETKEASSLKSEKRVKRVGSEKEMKDVPSHVATFPDVKSEKRAISTPKERSANNANEAKESKEATDDVATERVHVTRQSATIVPNPQNVRCSLSSATSINAATERMEAVTDVARASSLNSEISAKDELKEETGNGDTSTDNMNAIKRADSTHSSGSISSERRAESEAKESKEATDDADTCKKESRVKNTNCEKEDHSASTPSSAVKKTDATTFYEMLSTLATSTDNMNAIKRADSTHSSGSISSERSAKSAEIEAKESDADTSRKESRVKNTNCEKEDHSASTTSSAVKKTDATTFYEMLSTLQHVFDCNGDTAAWTGENEER
jgi:hypothetical protein